MNNLANDKVESRRDFLKKSVYVAPVLVALGALNVYADGNSDNSKGVVTDSKGIVVRANSSLKCQGGGNNGFGNGDQDAPGGSLNHNNAENSTNNIFGDDKTNNIFEDDKVKGNNGFGNGDQDAPGGSLNHNNAENAQED